VDVLKISSRSNPNAVAGAVAGAVRRDGTCQLVAVGAGALNQAVKAVAIAREHLRPDGVDAVCIPTFLHLEIDGSSRTGLSLVVEHRRSPAIDLRTPAPDDASTVAGMGAESSAL
jgi:stage V sporulation protein S